MRGDRDKAVGRCSGHLHSRDLEHALRKLHFKASRMMMAKEEVVAL